MAREAAGRPPEETLLLWKREQAQLKARVVDRDTEAWQRDPAFSGLQRVGGVDVSFVKGDSVNACASLVVLSYPELEVVYEDCRMVSLTAPYMSGFLAFREVPFLVDAVRRLQEREPHLMPQAGPSCGWKRCAPPPSPHTTSRRLLGSPPHCPSLTLVCPCRLWGGLPPRHPHRPALCRGGQETAAGGWAGEQRPAQGEDTTSTSWGRHVSSDGRLRDHPGHGRHPLPRLHPQDPGSPQGPHSRTREEPEGAEPKGSVPQGRLRRGHR
nr:endonuclease V isoform X11 [Manis javanica]